jgi:6-phosphogluconolactonase
MRGEKMTTFSIDIYQDYTAIGRDVIQWVAACVAEKGECSLALSGGGTPARLFEQLERSPRMPFAACSFYWCDERCVDPAHEQSNYGMAVRHMPSLLKGRAHRMRGEADSERAALEYDALLREQLPTGPGGFPELDLVLLGLGNDGHTASLFPGESGLAERKRSVVHQFVRKHDSHRLTITMGVIRAARKVMMLAVDKDDAVRMLKRGDSVLGAVEYVLK